MTVSLAMAKDGFKCDALAYQWEVIDVEDAILPPEPTPQDVVEKRTYADVISDAENRLDICRDEWNQEDAQYRKEERQLVRFLKKWGGK